MSRFRWVSAVLIVLVALIGTNQTQAQSVPAIYDVFYSSQAKPKQAGLFFNDARTGLSRVLVTDGENHTLLGEGVLYQERETGAVGYATPDGQIAPHPFISINPYLTWAVSANRASVIWTVGRVQAGSLIVELFLAKADGSDQRVILRTSSSKAIGVRAVAISDDGSTAYVSRQEERTGDEPPTPTLAPRVTATPTVPTARFGNVSALEVATGTLTPIPGEPCGACAVAVTADGKRVLRVKSEGNGFTANLYDLSVRPFTVTLPLDSTFTRADQAAILEKGSVAAYTIARGTGATVRNPETYAVVLLDAAARAQRTILASTPIRLRPVALQREMLLLVAVDGDGTYKVPVIGGALVQVSAATYLGSLSGKA